MASQLEKMIKVVPRGLVVIWALVQKRSHIVIQKTCYFGKEEMRCFGHFLFIKTNLFCRFRVPFLSSAAQLQSGQYVCTKIKRGIKYFYTYIVNFSQEFLSAIICEFHPKISSTV